MAKTARYSGDRATLFAEIKAVVESKFTVTTADEMALRMDTKARWYTPEGLAANDTGDVSMLQDKSINYAVVVEMLADGDKWLVKVTPVMTRYNRGIPKPEPVKEGDASLPGWCEDKSNTLAIDIHAKLAKYEVKGVPQMVPAGNEPPTPAPAPTEGSAAAPAEGSAAPATP